MTCYYNEHDEDKAAWLRELIREGVIADGEVDTRSIAEVCFEDLAGFSQHHFFAGIGVWSYALRLAGWPDDRPVWTGSCPCPSFSAAGKGGGFDDARHLWPDWARLIRKCRPATLFGEQADDAIGYGWLDLVQTDLEREDYAVGKAVLGACSVGAPHIRQRLYFVAHSAESRFSGDSDGGTICEGQTSRSRSGESERYGGNGGGLADSDLRGQPVCGEPRSQHDGEQRSESVRRMADSNGNQSRGRHGKAGDSREEIRIRTSTDANSISQPVGMGESNAERLQERERDGRVQRFALEAQEGQASECGNFVNGFWRGADWVLRKRWNSEDWEWCPTEPGTQQMVDGTSESVERVLRKDYETFPLATSVKNRVLKLKGYGDAIVAPLAAKFIQACME